MAEIKPPSCRLCGNDNGNSIFPVREMMFGFQEVFDYVECGSCKTIQIVKVPEDLGKYYPNEYYSLGEINYSNSIKKIVKIIRGSLFKWTKLNFLKHYHYGDWLEELDLPFNSKIGDIGCGNGQLLYEWSVSGYTSLVGIDPFISSSKRVNSTLTLLKKSIFEIEEKFDCLMMHHSFEHMENPKEVLGKAFDLLNQGGKLLVRIPLADKEAWRKYGADWVQLDAPRHLYLHSETSMKKLGESVGFTLGKTVYDSTPFQFWGSELNKKGIPRHRAKLDSFFSKEELEEYKKMSLNLNREGQGDQACFYFVKA
ncbi:class I SAM-dependent methyltransferase [Echinicola shivajiensis]|uniref:class I SAM-dependent methyltransferase n=1 Tax=Echinicola shivajiensis TaxID=1035916 RepID=UPI001BFC6115|nr:class I SAM-dependent methyltransferase [Echinicola shivajiensis]